MTESALTLATNLPDSFAGVPLILTGWQGSDNRQEANFVFGGH